MHDAIDKLDRIIEKLDDMDRHEQPRRLIWPHYLGFTIVLIGVFAGCAAYTMSNSAESAAAIREIKAEAEERHQRVLSEIRGLRRTIAMQREDPKAFPQLDAQFKAIEEYENAKNNRRNPD